mmetsp:Transcript_15220/g.46155  ORF Transcript_15220/g.46155 Transcript_15220/m.46155 type:complete len:321 (+) Transcript_15220:623-1585(+)
MGSREAVAERVEAVVAEVAEFVLEFVEHFAGVEVDDVLEAELVEVEGVAEGVVVELRKARVEVDQAALLEAVVGPHEGLAVHVKRNVMAVVGRDAVGLAELQGLVVAQRHHAHHFLCRGKNGGGVEDESVEVADPLCGAWAHREAHAANAQAFGLAAGQRLDQIRRRAELERRDRGLDDEGVAERGADDPERRRVRLDFVPGTHEPVFEFWKTVDRPAQNDVAAQRLGRTTARSRFEAVAEREVHLLQPDVRPAQAPQRRRADAAPRGIREIEHAHCARVAAELQNLEPKTLERRRPLVPGIQIDVLQVRERLVRHRQRR